MIKYIKPCRNAAHFIQNIIQRPHKHDNSFRFREFLFCIPNLIWPGGLKLYEQNVKLMVASINYPTNTGWKVIPNCVTRLPYYQQMDYKSSRFPGYGKSHHIGWVIVIAGTPSKALDKQLHEAGFKLTHIIAKPRHFQWICQQLHLFCGIVAEVGNFLKQGST